MADPRRWFERVKQQASPAELYAFLFALPKGADLHVHLSGSGTPADWYELASGEPEALWVRAADAACSHGQVTGPATVSRAALRSLPSCCQTWWVPLGSLTAAQRRAWSARLFLAAPHEAPDGFFAAARELSGQEDQAVDLQRLHSVYGTLRHRYPGVQVAVHAGEGFGPPYRVGPAVAAGARRIGHGLNLIYEPSVVEHVVATGVAVEVSMVSNQMLGHVPDSARHPAARLLRRGVPVCLSTDDPGMWGAQLTDEFYLAVTAWDCTWPEIAGMTRASLRHCFAPPLLRRVVQQRHERALVNFELLRWAAGTSSPPPRPAGPPQGTAARRAAVGGGAGRRAARPEP